MNDYLIWALAFGLVVLSMTNTITVVYLMIANKKNKELKARTDNLDEISNESYVKFLTDSRDWAYAYIEDVQNKLSSYAERVEPQLNYYNTYGSVVQGPHTIFVKEMTDAYEELKAVLPEENKEK